MCQKIHIYYYAWIIMYLTCIISKLHDNPEKVTVNLHFLWIPYLQIDYLLKFICNPQIKTQYFYGHSWTCAEWQTFESPNAHVPS